MLIYSYLSFVSSMLIMTVNVILIYFMIHFVTPMSWKSKFQNLSLFHNHKNLII